MKDIMGRIKKTDYLESAKESHINSMKPNMTKEQELADITERLARKLEVTNKKNINLKKGIVLFKHNDDVMVVSIRSIKGIMTVKEYHRKQNLKYWEDLEAYKNLTKREKNKATMPSSFNYLFYSDNNGPFETGYVYQGLAREFYYKDYMSLIEAVITGEIK